MVAHVPLLKIRAMAFTLHCIALSGAEEFVMWRELGEGNGEERVCSWSMRDVYVDHLQFVK